MISTIKLLGKVVTVITVAKTGYDIYKKGEMVYMTYQKTKSVKTRASKVVKKIKRILK